MTGYAEENERRVRYLMGVLRRREVKSISQAELARRASKPKTPITAAHVRVLTPMMEREARALGLWLNRPVYGNNRYSLSRQPWGAAFTMVQRWRHMIGRARNDAERGEMLLALTTCGDRDVERIAQRAYDSYLDLLSVNDRIKDEIEALVEALRERLTA